MVMLLVRVGFTPNLTWDFPVNDSGLGSENGMLLPCHFWFEVMFIWFVPCSKTFFPIHFKIESSSAVKARNNLKAPGKVTERNTEHRNGLRRDGIFLCCNCVRKYRSKTVFSTYYLTDCISGLLDSPGRDMKNSQEKWWCRRKEVEGSWLSWRLGGDGMMVWMMVPGSPLSAAGCFGKWKEAGDGVITGEYVNKT